MSRSPREWAVLIGAALSLGCGAAFAENSLSILVDSILPDVSFVKGFSRPGTMTLLSSNGEVIQKLGPATREKVTPGGMPILLKKAFVAAEDRRFYKHKGVDLWGIGRAIATNLRQGAVRQGASTITQQLARTVFLTQERTLTRKLKEAALAYKLERQLNKQQILEQYLNNVYLGSGAYGVGDASWVYFSKNPEQLSLAEAALIAGLAPAPSIYSPLVNADISLKRRSIVLERMYQVGFISKEELSNAKKKQLNLKPAIPKYFNSSAPFFTSWVAQQLPEFLTAEQLEIGGLKIHTSLNLNWQKEAQKVLRESSPNNSEGAIVSIQPSTGLVKVLVGGKDFNTTQFNRATQALRSPGSTFKLFPYAAALSLGYRPQDKFIDTPTCWYGYCPKNFGNKYLGEVSMAEAFKYSLNTIAVKVLEEVGFKKVIKIANNLGVGNKNKLGQYYPLAIGAYEQTVMDMTAAYSAVANRGVYIKPTPFEEIRGPNNELLWSRKINGPKGKRSLRIKVADTLNSMLQEVVRDGSGVAASLKNHPVAGKTGTSEGGRDLWFIGSIPQLTTAVWFGHDDNRETNSNSSDAAKAWKEFMERIIKEFASKEFPKNPFLPESAKQKNSSINSMQSIQITNQGTIEELPEIQILPGSNIEIMTTLE